MESPATSFPIKVKHNVGGNMKVPSKTYTLWHQEDSIAAICRKFDIHQNSYFKWSKDFMEAGKRRLSGDVAREANRDEVAELKQQTDFTYFKIIAWGWYFLSTVMDDYSRYIISWDLRSNMTSEDVKPSTKIAMKKTGLTKNTAPKLLSDNGSCYISNEIKTLL